MQSKKKKIYLGSLVIAIIVGIYIINANYKGIISKIIVKNNSVTNTDTEETNKIFESQEFGAVVLANMVKDEKDPEKAKKIVEESIPHIAEEEKYKLYYNLANSYCGKKDYKNCIYYVDKAIAFNSECYTCYNMRGLANMSLNNIEESVADYTKGLNIKEEAILYANRAILYSDYLNSNEKAIADLKAAINLDKSYNQAKFSLFELYYIDKNTIEAKKVFELIKQTLNPSYGENYAILQMHEAVIMLLDNNLTGSIKIMEKVFTFLENLKQESINTYHYALIYTKMNIIIDELIILKNYHSVLKYTNSLEKLEKKYNYEGLKKDILIFREVLKKAK